MINFKEWKALRYIDEAFEATESTAQAVTDDNAEIDPNDFTAYHQVVQGKVGIFLKRFTDALEANPNTVKNINKKGFVLEEVITALGLDPMQIPRLIMRIRNAKKKYDAAQKQLPVEPAKPTTPANLNGSNPAMAGAGYGSKA